MRTVIAIVLGFIVGSLFTHRAANDYHDRLIVTAFKAGYRSGTVDSFRAVRDALYGHGRHGTAIDMP